jgi:hypothetical protein
MASRRPGVQFPAAPREVVGAASAVASGTSAWSSRHLRHNGSVTVLVGTERGLLSVDDDVQLLAGESITAMSGQWVLVGDDRLVSLTSGVELKLETPRAWCLLDAGERLYVGTAEARLFSGPSSTPELAAVDSFDRIATRHEWYTPWGAPPDTRSLAASADGTLFVNVHVGGVWRQWADDGWDEVISVDHDTHQVAANTDDDGVVVAAAAVGFGRSLDDGNTWDWTSDGLHASYCRAVAVADGIALVTASTGPQTRQGAIYRRPLRSDEPFEKCHAGLPEWFPFNLDTFQLAASGNAVDLGTKDGRVYRSLDSGATWELVVEELPPIHAVSVR